MQEVQSAIQIKKNFDFVDTIRCLSMIGIVFEHTEVFGSANYVSFYTSLLQASVLQFFKFATVAFFLIAGFLINHKFTEYTPWQYLKNRFKSTIGPWAFWINVLILIDIINLLFIAYFKYNGERHMPSPFADYLISSYYYIITETSFWFILNFLICIGILLLFKRFIYNKIFGVLLGLTSLFYSINLYHGWIRTRHTTALFGFVFFLWLGAYMNKHSEILFNFIKKISFIWLTGITIVLFIMSDLEIIYLKSIGMEDAYNTLRVSNILYSLSFFLILLKVGSIPSVNRIFQPRNTTFGIYLIHPIIILHFLDAIFRPFHWHAEGMTAIGAIAYSALRFGVTYLISILIVRGLLVTKLRWTIGSSVRN
ncbi:Acyltransferase family protein [Pedobacter westerhofensis]|uniref:Acyltransferase family protein n=1 Tax=Pedobacter westerhofensis TaxID=425512 RepID=A0A521EIR4_9SPHI|nr:acyltransferase [Pedobacter westerhofensis]SMO83798.1 Acyltransferase family protein [Pedobacter westerhofensis]